MSKVPVCKNPVVYKDQIHDPGFNIFANPEKVEYINQVRPYTLDAEIVGLCAATCRYCYTASNMEDHRMIPKEKLLEVIDQVEQLGMKFIFWAGGELFYHPDWYECMSYAADKGITGMIVTSGLIPKNDLKKIMALEPRLESVSVHIDTIVPPIYRQLHRNPKTLEPRMKGAMSLMEAGFPREKLMAIITYTHLAAESIEETVDWFVDELGATSLCMPVFKPCGYGPPLKELFEPTAAEVKRACEYRARKLGDYWLRIGSSDGSQFYCRTNISLKVTGDICPCGVMPEKAVGNIYRESLIDIFEKHGDYLMFNERIQGACGSCPNNDVCFGCRANAYHYLGDEFASDPKCWLNPETRELYFREA